MKCANIDRVIANINVSDILDTVNIGIWLVEYSPVKQIYRMYGNKSFLRILGLQDIDEISPEECYRYWFSRIDENCLKDVQSAIGNIIDSFNNRAEGCSLDEVCYVWHKDGSGLTNVRCGGKVADFRDDVYTMCGYHQDYTDIVRMRKHVLGENSVKLEKELQNITYLKDYYQELAYIDELTGLVNRRGFLDKAKNILEHKMRRRGDTLWLGILDLDFFKHVNDTYGHLNGDAVLKNIGRILLNMSLDNKDIYVFRYGGEEFIILIYQHNLGEVKRLVDGCREKVKNLRIDLEGGSSISITCSIGMTCIQKQKGMTSENLIHWALQRADLLLYKAKKEGRNRVCIDGCRYAGKF